MYGRGRLTSATILLVGLARLDLGEHRRFSIPFLFAASILMTIAGVAFGVSTVTAYSVTRN